MAKNKGGGGGGGHDNNKNKNKGKAGGGENWKQQFLTLQGQMQGQPPAAAQPAADQHAWWQAYAGPEPSANATPGGPSTAEQGYGGFVPTVAPARYNVTPPQGGPPAGPGGPGGWGGSIGGNIGGGTGQVGAGTGGHKHPGMGPNNRRRQARNPYAPTYGGTSGGYPTAGIGAPAKRKQGVYY